MPVLRRRKDGKVPKDILKLTLQTEDSKQCLKKERHRKGINRETLKSELCQSKYRKIQKYLEIKVADLRENGVAEKNDIYKRN